MHLPSVARASIKLPVSCTVCNEQLMYTHKKWMDIDEDFSLSLSYTLSCYKCSDLNLKDKRLEAMKAVYDGDEIFVAA